MLNSINKKIAMLLFLVFSVFIVTMCQLLYTFNSLNDDGVAINLSGSQRMRTMLLSNYSLLYKDASNGNISSDIKDIKNTLTKELAMFKKINSALISGDDSLNISENKNMTIVTELKRIQQNIEKYETSVDNVINNVDVDTNVEYIYNNALELKGMFNTIVLMYQKQYDNKISRFKIMLYVYLMIGIIILFIGIGIAKKTIVIPIKKITEKLGEIASGSGDLTKEIDIKSNDEIGVLAQNFNAFLKDIREMVATIDSSSKEIFESIDVLVSSTNEVAVTSNKLSVATNEIAVGSNEQAQDVSATAENIIDLGNEINSIRNLSQNMKEYSEKIRTLNENNKNNMDMLYKHNQENFAAATDIYQAIEKLYENTLNISTITEVITNIANQTNMLALNASIEAARAGEHGRGFAIVANEVSNLADQSEQSISQIAELISVIQEDVKNTKILMEKIMKLTKEQSKAVEVTKQDFEVITDSLGRIIDKIDDVTDKVTIVDKNKNNIIETIENISAVSEETAASTEEFAAFSDKFNVSVREINNITIALKHASKNLSDLIGQFKY
ncbi:methyl-accepting chemotaxis protein McpC [Clostridium tepidiprofundi DSM 19306]|uniref:Methyl-accepting chemotaxis protein McpC n=1 Tax=Clostridium tepidiprofundi DSM 19306 TaxID=1121338 RepID=A0A151B6V8_9CLOT|nr:methyl-accepting chemotaxis protein [Clostridium tepidiprofundi]KYH35533.1 methyl-accepting chemotaxis protein McpC [Clostridium tepidiprofundi DSM 19306]